MCLDEGMWSTLQGNYTKKRKKSNDTQDLLPVQKANLVLSSFSFLAIDAKLWNLGSHCLQWDIVLRSVSITMYLHNINFKQNRCRHLWLHRATKTAVARPGAVTSATELNKSFQETSQHPLCEEGLWTEDQLHISSCLHLKQTIKKVTERSH